MKSTLNSGIQLFKSRRYERERKNNMNPMYDCSGCFDRFGGVVEPPDDYYFAPRINEEPEWQRPDEADSVCWGD